MVNCIKKDPCQGIRSFYPGSRSTEVVECAGSTVLVSESLVFLSVHIIIV